MQHIETFAITYGGQDMIVSYEPSYFKMKLAHFEFTSPFEPRRRIPISETGYYSHFVASDEVEAAGGAVEYANLFVRAVVKSKAVLETVEDEQLSLF